jgi:hypothetical protein
MGHDATQNIDTGISMVIKMMLGCEEGNMRKPLLSARFKPTI